MIIEVQIVGDKDVIARFQAAGTAAFENVRTEVNKLTLQLENLLKSEFLSGPTGDHTLSVITGRLRRSAFSRVSATSGEIVGNVGYGAEVPYAAIHEFGGTIHIPEIVPVTAQALHFMVGGQEVFAKRARAHDVTMPERAPLRTAFEQMIPEIEMRLFAAVSSSFI